jgi:hypothetical protein
MRVRRQMVHDAIKYLIKNNKYYGDYVANLKEINNIPLDGFGEPQHWIEDKTDKNTTDITVTQPIQEDSNIDCAVLNSNINVALQSIKDRAIDNIINFPTRALHPINEFQTKGLLNLAFPHLFFDSSVEYFRSSKFPIAHLTFIQFANNIITHKEPRFRRDLILKFFLTDFFLRTEILRSGRLTLNKNKFIKNLDIEQLRLKLADQTFRNSINIYKKNVIGSTEFWLQEKNCLESMTINLGMPIIFLTMSSNDYYWHDLKTLYKVTGNQQLREEVNIDPSIAVAYFHTKVQVFITDFLYKFLNITAHYGKIEFQSRGSLHIHLLLWHSISQKIFTQEPLDVAAVLEFADNIISAKNPYFDTSNLCLETTSELCSKSPLDIDNIIEHANKMANAVCRHTKCAAYCLKKVNNHLACRYGYPKDLNDKTYIKLNNKKQLEIFYARNDPLCNPHIKILLGMFNSNIDTQMCLSKTKMFTYLMKYMCKPEKLSDIQKQVQAILIDQDIQKSQSLLQKVFMVECKRTICAQEAFNILLNLPLTLCNYTFRKINTSFSRCITSEGLLSNHMQIYSTRPSDMENLTMYECFQQYSYRSKKFYRNRDTKFILVPTPYYKHGSDAYFKRECILHSHWRQISDIKNDDVVEWETVYKTLTRPYKTTLDFRFDDLDVNMDMALL